MSDREIKTDTPLTDKEAMWATSGTGDEFQCLHLDDAKDIELALRNKNNDLIKELRELVDKWNAQYDKVDFLDSLTIIGIGHGKRTCANELETLLNEGKYDG